MSAVVVTITFESIMGEPRATAVRPFSVEPSTKIGNMNVPSRILAR